MQTKIATADCGWRFLIFFAGYFGVKEMDSPAFMSVEEAEEE